MRKPGAVPIALRCAGLLLLLPAAASGQSTPEVGVVVSAGQAQIRGTGVLPGNNVLSGDVVVTTKGSQVAIRSGQTQFLLHEDSAAGFYSSGSKVLIELERGALTYSSAAGGTFEIVAADLRMTAQEGMAEGEVRLVGDCELQVTSNRGKLQVLRGKEQRTIREASTAQLTPVHALEKPSQRLSPGDPQYHTRHTHLACKPAAQARGASWFLPVAFVEAATATAMILAFKDPVSPNRP
jgi:co-chaperonin GroES (HSP10)